MAKKTYNTMARAAHPICGGLDAHEACRTRVD